MAAFVVIYTDTTFEQCNKTPTETVSKMRLIPDRRSFGSATMNAAKSSL